MSCYVTRKMAEEALANMRSFHSELDSLYKKYDFSNIARCGVVPPPFCSEFRPGHFYR